MNSPSPNLFWSVYKNLEKEFLVLANYIHISDDQLNIYSMHIADLIIRCSVEIESLSKELYASIGGNMAPVDDDGNPRDLYFDTDCLELLEQKWHISKKEISVSAINLFLDKAENITLVPLHKSNKRGTSGSKWKQAYQAIKHDRNNSLKKATVDNLLHALGALYILNLYYKSERTDIGRVYLSDHNFDSRAGSDIFSAHICHATGLSMSYYMDDSCINPPIGDELDKAIYIIKYDDKSFQEMHKNFCLDAQITEKNFNNSPEIKKFLESNPEYKSKSITEVCMAAGGESLLLRIICFRNTTQEKNSRMEAMINKHSGIYQTLTPISEET